MGVVRPSLWVKKRVVIEAMVIEQDSKIKPCRLDYDLMLDGLILAGIVKPSH